MHSVYISLAIALACLTGCRPATKVEASEQSTDKPAAAGPATQCGKSGLPDCPLQRWMKATLQTYQRANDYDRLARAFGELAEHAPDGYDGWKSTSQRGAERAAAKDDAAVRQICKDCHGTHRTRYRNERRAAPTW